jgi:hypothetical protein
MMRPILVLTTLLTSSTLAANTIKFINHCPYPFYVWTVGAGQSGEDKDARIVLPNDSSYIMGMINTEASGAGGQALKIRDLPNYRTAPAGILQLEYYLEPSRGKLWYDLSLVDCNPADAHDSPRYCPLVAGGVQVYTQGQEDMCPTAWCSGSACHNTYTTAGSWQGEPTLECEFLVFAFTPNRVSTTLLNGQSPIFFLFSSS